MFPVNMPHVIGNDAYEEAYGKALQLQERALFYSSQLPDAPSFEEHPHKIITTLYNESWQMIWRRLVDVTAEYDKVFKALQGEASVDRGGLLMAHSREVVASRFGALVQDGYAEGKDAAEYERIWCGLNNMCRLLMVSVTASTL